jgi:hypothetical protein
MYDFYWANVYPLTSTDYVLFLFLDDYLGRLEGPIATQVWNRFVSLAKDIAANVYTFKMQVFPMLRLVHSSCLSNSNLKPHQLSHDYFGNHNADYGNRGQESPEGSSGNYLFGRRGHVPTFHRKHTGSSWIHVF